MGILNAANNALKGISNLTKGALGGSLAQPNVDLFGLNIPGVPLVSFRDAFLRSMETWIASIPLRTQYIIFFDTFPVGLTLILLESWNLLMGLKETLILVELKLS